VLRTKGVLRGFLFWVTSIFSNGIFLKIPFEKIEVTHLVPFLYVFQQSLPLQQAG
jgi:hypothetical protein